MKGKPVNQLSPAHAAAGGGAVGADKKGIGDLGLDLRVPSLEDLKTRVCSPSELQAAILHLIELHNGLNEKITAMERSGRIQSARDAYTNATYGL